MKSYRKFSWETKVMIGLAEYGLDDIGAIAAWSAFELDWNRIYTTACINPYKMKERYRWYCNMNEPRCNLGVYA